MSVVKAVPHGYTHGCSPGPAISVAPARYNLTNSLRLNGSMPSLRPRTTPVVRRNLVHSGARSTTRRKFLLGSLALGAAMGLLEGQFRAATASAAPAAPQVINIQSYGARGDGIADDTDAFLAALASAQASNGELFLAPGHYKITRTIRFSGPSVTISGTGEDSVLDYAATTGNCLELRNLQGAAVRDLSIKGRDDAIDGSLIAGSGASNVMLQNVVLISGLNGASFDSGSALRISNCRVQTPNNVGILIGGSEANSVVDSCVVRGAGRSGIRAISTSHDTTIMNCVVSGGRGLYGSSGGGGIHIQESSANRIINCLSSDNVNQGILIDVGGPGGVAQHNLIESCASLRNRGESGEGITLFGGWLAAKVTDNIVRLNVCADNETNQIEIYDTGGSNVIEANTCEAPLVTPTNGMQNGIFVGALAGRGSPGTIVRGNTVRNCPKNGIQILDSPGCAIIDNTCTDNNQAQTPSATDQNGITLNGASTDCLVRGNVCSNAAGGRQQYGVRIENTAWARLQSNELVGNAMGPLLDSVGSSTLTDDD
jgi:parallel beta-helix repeat protein